MECRRAPGRLRSGNVFVYPRHVSAILILSLLLIRFTEHSVSASSRNIVIFSPVMFSHHRAFPSFVVLCTTISLDMQLIRTWTFVLIDWARVVRQPLYCPGVSVYCNTYQLYALPNVQGWIFRREGLSGTSRSVLSCMTHGKLCSEITRTPLWPSHYTIKSVDKDTTSQPQCQS